ncbi:MAG: hypothetical protein QM811_24160 [Pirellulales bacterium]
MRGFLLAFLLVLHGTIVRCAEVEIADLNALAEYAARDGNTVTMKPGRYRIADLVTPESIPARRKQGEFSYLRFTGSKNVFRLSGVVIEFDTALRKTMNPPIHTDEFVVAGEDVTLDGLTIVDVGDAASLGGAVLGVTGKNAVIRNCAIEVRGSAPYGYGDLFGKGGRKKSAVHITGDGARFLNCRVTTHAFGHGFYLQEDAANVHLENCVVEGVMRSTNAMLAETEGMAFDRAFRTEDVMRGGEKRILPDYMKALSEDAFRTYGTHKNLTLKNCTAKRSAAVSNCGPKRDRSWKAARRSNVNAGSGSATARS